MEVHAHSHTERKKWTHYLWEFLMLFFAVTLGFFVENQREHFIEHKREVEYVRSLVEDLKEDTAAFNHLVEVNSGANQKIDTLIALLTENERNTSVRKIYYLARTIPLADADLNLQNKTFEQMKSSGGLRLIRNPLTQNKIGSYYQNNKTIETGFIPMQFQGRLGILTGLEELFDVSVMQEIMKTPAVMSVDIPDNRFKLLTNDPAVINRFCFRYHLMYGVKKVTIINARSLFKEATSLMQYLQEEYHIK